jgi:hypothetical protein
MHIEFWWENLSGRNRLKDRHADEKVMLKWIFEERNWGFMGWIYLAENGDRKRAVLKVVIKLRFS